MAEGVAHADAFPRHDGLRRLPAVLADGRRGERNAAEHGDAQNVGRHALDLPALDGEDRALGFLRARGHRQGARKDQDSFHIGVVRGLSFELEGGPVGGELGVERLGRDDCLVVEEGETAVVGGRRPVPHDKTVQRDDGVEDARVVVGVMRVVGMEDDVAALVADEVFVEGGKEEDAAAAEAAGACLRVDVEVAAFPALGAEFVAEGGDAAPAVIDIQPGPPDEVLQCGGAMTSEVFACKEGEGLFVAQYQGIANLFRHEGQRPLGRVEVPRAQQARELRQAEMVGEPLLGHLDVPRAEGFREELLLDAAMPRERFAENAGNMLLLVEGNVHAVGVHPTAEAGEGLASAEFQHPAQILSGEELPGRPQQVRPDDPPVVVGLLEGLAGGLAGPHRHGPAHGLVVLGLHGPEPGHDFRRVLELRGRELLAQEALGDRIHTEEGLQIHLPGTGGLDADVVILELSGNVAGAGGGGGHVAAGAVHEDVARTAGFQVHVPVDRHLAQADVTATGDPD